MKVAVFGSAGQLGTDLMKALGEQGIAIDHSQADVTDPHAVKSALEKIRPDWVVNCASKTHVDQCQEDVAGAFAVNAVGAWHVANSAASVGARVCYISTDYVFAGDQPVGDSYGTQDPPSPINVYGASKYAGEILVRQSAPDALIVRVSSLFGVAGARGKGGNFVETILGRAESGQPLQVVNDQWMSPTSTADASIAIRDFLKSGRAGVVHVCNSGSCTWHQFACAILQAGGFGTSVDPVAAVDWGAPAPRPPNSTMVASVELPRWQDALADYMKRRVRHE